MCRGHVGGGLFVPPERLDDQGQLRIATAEPPRSRLVGVHRGVGEASLELAVLGDDIGQRVEHPSPLDAVSDLAIPGPDVSGLTYQT